MSRAGKIGIVLLLLLLLISLTVSAFNVAQTLKVKTIETKTIQPQQQKTFTNLNIKDYNVLDIGKHIINTSKAKYSPQQDQISIRKEAKPKRQSVDISFSEILKLKEQTTSSQDCIGNNLVFCSQCIVKNPITRVKLTSDWPQASKVIEICKAHGASAMRSTCLPIPITDYNLGYLNEGTQYFAWCDLKLKITNGPRLTITDVAQGAIKVTWDTSLPSSEKIVIYEQANGQEIASTQEKNNNVKHHEATYNGLSYGTYLVRVESKTSALWPIPAQEVQSSQISFQIRLTPIELTFVDPTPQDNAQLLNDQLTVTISSNRELQRATLHLTNRDGSTTPQEMQGNGITFSQTFNSRAGQISYYVEAIAGDGTTKRTETRSATVPFPQVNFAQPTPSNNEVLTDPDFVRIAASVSEPVLSATLELTNTATHSTTTSLMSKQSAQFYFYAFSNLPPGQYSQRVSITDDEGDTAETDERLFTIAHVVSTPELTFLSPTPNNGIATSAKSTTVKISSSEPLASATLQWRHPNGATATYTMTKNTATEFTYTVTNLVEGTYTYSVNAIDVQGDAGSTGERTFTVQVTPPQITFVNPTPASGTALSNTDETTIAISSSEPLSSATLSLTNVVETKTIQMNQISSTQFQVQLKDLLNGTNTFQVNAIDVDGDSGASESRTFTTPITVQLHEFQGEGIGSMAVYNVNSVSTMFVGTFNETTPGKSHVYKSIDGINWVSVFTANQSNWFDRVTTSVTGVYSMAVYNNELYIGTGSSIAGAIDGDIYKTNDGVNWNRVYHNDNQQINRLTVIDNTLFAGTKTSTGTGNIMWYNQTDTWGRKSTSLFEITAIEKYNGQIYYGGGWYLFKMDQPNPIVNLDLILPTASIFIQAMKATDALYLGSFGVQDKTLLRSTDGINWSQETLANTGNIRNIRTLSDNKLYLTSASNIGGKLWRRNQNGINEVIADFTPLNRAVDILEFKGKKYVTIAESIDENSGYTGYIYKITG
ncbi:MAG: hypothetical protein V1722_04085 [Candidatus Micrarchaeota archaeon]